MIPRILFAAVVWLAAPAWGAPPLTTVQDVLYKADGTRFNGVLTISWKSFEAGDRSAIAMHNISARVVDGNLRVQLVPTTNSSPAVFYQVIYNSDGRIQFQETWSVPEANRPLRIRDVRIGTSPVAPDTDSGVPITETEVIGLIADLGMRPVKGPGFAAGRVVVVGPGGALESVSGSGSDCVRVDGSAVPCGTQAPAFIDGEAPGGIVDGANTDFSLSASPQPAGSLTVYRNGLLQKPGLDYNLTGNSLRFVPDAAPQPGDTLLVSYRMGGDEGGGGQSFPVAQVICGGTGSSTNSTALGAIGSCTIPAGLLRAGDRVEVRLDLKHQGSAGGFSFEVGWGQTILAHRDAASTDTFATGRIDAAILASGAQLGYQTWGTVLPFAAGLATAGDSYDSGITLEIRGKVSQASDSLTLVNYTVVRMP